MTDAKTLSAAEQELREATEHMASMQRVFDNASRERTSAVNRLNEAQKEFDAAVERTRKVSTVQGSDWHHRRSAV